LRREIRRGDRDLSPVAALPKRLAREGGGWLDVSGRPVGDQESKGAANACILLWVLRNRTVAA